MEESKIQALHDALSKLRRSAGLGVSSQYSWSAAPTKKDENGNVVREDGLPTNALYANFLREGSYDGNSAAARKYGDGRVIKRNFDDCALEGSSKDSSSGDEDSETRRRRKAEKKERKKAEKKAAKLEAKRQAKLEEKRRLKRETKALAKNLSQAEMTKDKTGKDDNVSASCKKAIKTAKKTLKRQESGTMKIKELAKTVAEKVGGEHDFDSVKRLIKKSDDFEMEGKVVRFVKERKKHKRAEKDEEDSPELPSSSVISAVPSSPPPKKRRKKDKCAQKQ